MIFVDVDGSLSDFMRTILVYLFFGQYRQIDLDFLYNKNVFDGGNYVDLYK